ncbi:MAG: SPOR domain-containing protein [Mariprofundales bacterium]
MLALFYRQGWLPYWYVARDTVSGWVFSPPLPQAHVPLVVDQDHSLSPQVTAAKVQVQDKNIEIAASATVGDVIASLVASTPRPKSPASGGSVAPEPPRYYVQLASFKQQQEAERMARRVRKAGFSPQVSRYGQWWRVRLEGGRDRQDARRLADRVAHRFHLQPMVRRYH